MRSRHSSRLLFVLVLTLLRPESLRAQDQQNSSPGDLGHSKVYRSLQIATIAAPIADAVWTLKNRPYGNITEMNPFLRGRDGAAIPWRVVVAKTGQSAAVLAALRYSQGKSRKTKAAIYLAAAGIASLDTWAAYHNAHLEKLWYRYYIHY